MKKLEAAVTLFAAIEARQHEALRRIAFNTRRSIADLVRDALDRYIRAENAHAAEFPSLQEVGSVVIRRQAKKTVPVGRVNSGRRTESAKKVKL